MPVMVVLAVVHTLAQVLVQEHAAVAVLVPARADAAPHAEMLIRNIVNKN